MSKKRRSDMFKIFTMAVIAFGTVYAALYIKDIDLSFHTAIPDIISIAEKMNIKNLVTVIYLGPRIFDTLLEVMVVLLTVYGIQYIHKNRGIK